ncbi:MAG: radical SAM protein, partial [Eubacteriales bacterium]
LRLRLTKSAMTVDSRRMVMYGKAIKTPTAPILCSDFPSPYKAGIFDNILKEYPDIRFSAILETNRGCPYSCAFCDWCELTSKVRIFPSERVLGDLEWMSDHKIEFCYCADANFGIFARDEKFIDKLIDLNKKNGYPKKFRVNYAKHNNETVFNINKKLNTYGISKGATISFQSLDPKVLENIGRKNMSLSKFSELMTLYGNAGIPTYSELILGLPGETYESFCEGIGKLLEAGQHTSILIYNCELIVNSLMADKSYMDEFGIKASVTPLYLRHDEPDCQGIQEFSRSVTATTAMNENEWINSNLFSLAVQSCHGMGLLRWFAVYLYNEKGIKYQEFYKSLVKWAETNPDTVIGKEMLFMRGEFIKITENSGLWSYTNKTFGNVSWPYEEGVYLDLVYRFEDFYKEIRQFLADYKIEKDVFDDLLLYQKSIIKIPGVRSVNISLEYDFPGYFSKAFVNSYKKLKKKKVELFAEDNSLPYEWKDYAKEYIWYGRKEQKNIFMEFTVQ